MEQRYAAVTQWQGTLEVTDQGGWSNDCRGYKTDNTAVVEDRAVAKFRLVAKPNEQKDKADSAFNRRCV